MSRVIEAFPCPPWQRYPWAEWLDGQPRELVQGVDYDLPRQLVRAARNYAHNHGFGVRVSVRGDRLYLQALLSAEAAE